MSDADRLRQAADRLDEMAVQLERMHIKVAANPAALLRDIAEEWECDVLTLGAPVWFNTADSALALADVVLGRQR